MPRIPVAQRSVQAETPSFQPGGRLDTHAGAREGFYKDLQGVRQDFAEEMAEAVDQGEATRATVLQNRLERVAKTTKDTLKQEQGLNAADVQERGVQYLLKSPEFEELSESIDNTGNPETATKAVINLLRTKENLSGVLGGHAAEQLNQARVQAGQERIKTLADRVASAATGKDVVSNGNQLYETLFDFNQSVRGLDKKTSHLNAATGTASQMKASILKMNAEGRAQDALAMYQYAMSKRAEFGLPPGEDGKPNPMNAKIKKEIQAGLKGLDQKELKNDAMVESTSRYLNDGGLPLPEKIKEMRRLLKNAPLEVRRRVEKNIRAHEQMTGMAEEAVFDEAITNAITKSRESNQKGEFKSIFSLMPPESLAKITPDQHRILTELEERTSANTTKFESKFIDYKLRYKDRPEVMLANMRTNEGYTNVLSKLGKHRIGDFMNFLTAELDKGGDAGFATYSSDDEIELVESAAIQSMGAAEALSPNKVKRKAALFFYHFNRMKTQVLQMTKKKKLTRPQAERIMEIVSERAKEFENGKGLWAAFKRLVLDRKGEGVVNKGLKALRLEGVESQISDWWGAAPAPPVDMKEEEIPFRFYQNTPSDTTPQKEGTTPKNTPARELPSVSWKTKVNQRAVNSYLKKRGLLPAAIQKKTLLDQLAAALASGNKADIEAVASRLKRRK